jgi:TfoX/Sxy family transcriptional regulator of competence genes
MAYDTGLEQRIDEVVAGWGLELPKKKMFSGIGYFIDGNLAFGISKDDLIVRTTEEQGKAMLEWPGIRPFQMGARKAMKNWLFAGGEAIAEDKNLLKLLEISRDFALTLPPK